MNQVKIGIIGGTGIIGSGIAKFLLLHETSADNLWICNRSQKNLLCDNADMVNYTSDSQELIDACDVVIIAVRPTDFANMVLRFNSQLLISVMAGVTIEALKERTQASSIVRAMPNAAVEIGKSFTPWYSRYLSFDHQLLVRYILSSSGDEYALSTELQLDYFTALTGSGQGMLAAIAASMQESAVLAGVKPVLAEKAIRSLFSGIGQLIEHDDLSPIDRASDCVDYAGTTAEGINGMRASGLDKVIRNGIEQAYLKAQSNMMEK